MEDERVCESCSYWESSGTTGSYGEEVYGFCHRFAPRPIVVLPDEFGSKRPISLWAKTAAIDWCGEYAPRGRT